MSAGAENGQNAIRALASIAERVAPMRSCGALIPTTSDQAAAFRQLGLVPGRRDDISHWPEGLWERHFVGPDRAVLSGPLSLVWSGLVVVWFGWSVAWARGDLNPHILSDTGT